MMRMEIELEIIVMRMVLGRSLRRKRDLINSGKVQIDKVKYYKEIYTTYISYIMTIEI